MRRLLVLRVLGVVLLAAAALWALAISPAFAADPPAYKLGSGDKIRVTVYNEKDLSGDYDVGGQGSVALPLIGQVSVSGKTIAEAVDIITKAYAKDYLVDPRVSVEVLNYRPFFILGEVTKPGSYPYVSGLTVIQAVTFAGGYTQRADKKDIHIKHADHEGDEQPAQEDTVVLPGDVIRVEERFF